MIELDLNENNQQDVRWKQRFQNFSRAFTLLRSAVESKNIDEFSELEQMGIIQAFECTFELAWKTLKDYLDELGAKLSNFAPKTVIKECAALNIFDEPDIDAQIFIDMVESRNAMSHMYDSAQFQKELVNINEKYVAELEKLYKFLSPKEKEE